MKKYIVFCEKMNAFTVGINYVHYYLIQINNTNK